MDDRERTTKTARELFLAAQTELIYAALTGAMKLPGPTLAKIISGIRSVSGDAASPEDPTQPGLLEELEAFFIDDGKPSEALRRVILEARPSQAKSFIRGYLVNYVYDW